MALSLVFFLSAPSPPSSLASLGTGIVTSLSPSSPPPSPPDEPVSPLKYKLPTVACAGLYHGSPTYTCTFLNTLRSSRGISVQAALLFTHTDTVFGLNTIFT